MVISVKLRLTKAFLGDRQPDNQGVRRMRMENGRVQFTDREWRDRFEKANRELGLEVNLDTIHPPRGIVPATIRLYRREWNGARVDLFESFPKGMVLTMKFMIDNQSPKSPNPDQFKMLLSFIGEWMGFTQWGGGKMGYGTFTVEKIEPVTHQNYAEFA